MSMAWHFGQISASFLIPDPINSLISSSLSLFSGSWFDRMKLGPRGSGTNTLFGAAVKNKDVGRGADVLEQSNSGSRAEFMASLFKGFMEISRRFSKTSERTPGMISLSWPILDQGLEGKGERER